MARYLHSLLLAWYFFIVTVSKAEQPVSFNHGFLYGRADGDTDSSDPGLQCTRFCETSVGSQGPRSLNGRSNSPCGLSHASARNSYQPLFFDTDDNENATEYKLAKRALTKIDNNAEAAKHVMDVIGGKNGWNVPPGFIDGKTAAAYQYLRRFGEESFSFGTPGLHGCTMVAIISKRAIFIGHYWETYSTHGDDDKSGNSKQQFIQRVVNAIVNVKVTNPYNPPEAFDRSDRIARNHKYVPPKGDKMDFSLFNEEGDNTMMYIMTPLKAGKKEDSTDLAYKYKYSELLTNEIRRRQRIAGCAVTITGYKRLVYTINDAGNPEMLEGHEDDWDEYVDPKQAKGMALFEYDGGTKDWQLFWEDKYWKGKANS